MSAILYPYQRRWLDDKSRFKIGMFARQTGKTFTDYVQGVQMQWASGELRKGRKSGEIVRVRLGSYDGERVRAEMV
mgnify:CR=1 FL=1